MARLADTLPPFEQPESRTWGGIADHRPAPRPPALPRRIALLGNALPRRCGIATFTAHVHAALRTLDNAPSIDVYAMVDPGQHYVFPALVTTIDQEDRADYVRAARRIGQTDADLLWVQHEFGIFGGEAGSHLFDLLDATLVPVVATLHTVLEQPNAAQAAVLKRLAARATLLIVMARRARLLLQTIYDVPADKIAVIEHGVPDRPYSTPAAARRQLGVEDRKTIMTFGLLSPDKGIETAIRAMPAILDRCPGALYHIVGATHPHLRAREGERYRQSLQALARSLGVAAQLRWDGRFLDEDALLDRLATADVYVTPYRNAQQITSGTLAYAAALGKAIVATPYVHATELLGEGRGRLVGFDDPAALGEAVGTLLVDDTQRERLAAHAYAHCRTLTWANMVRRVCRRFGEVAAGAALGTHDRLAPSPAQRQRSEALSLA